MADLKTPIFHSEINWPLKSDDKNGVIIGYRCPICTKTFSKNNSLSSHIQHHNRGKDFDLLQPNNEPYQDSIEKSGALHNSDKKEQPKSVKNDLRLKPKVAFFKRKSCLICSKKYKTKTALAKQCDSSWHQYATKSIWERWIKIEISFVWKNVWPHISLFPWKNMQC